jgi:hypothetical protein
MRTDLLPNFPPVIGRDVDDLLDNPWGTRHVGQTTVLALCCPPRGD